MCKNEHFNQWGYSQGLYSSQPWNYVEGSYYNIKRYYMPYGGNWRRRYTYPWKRQYRYW